MTPRSHLGLWLNIVASTILLASATPLPLEVAIHDVSSTTSQDTIANLPNILNLDIDNNLIPVSYFPTIPPSSESKAPRPPHPTNPHPQNLLPRGENDSTSTSTSTSASPKEIKWIHSNLNAPSNTSRGGDDSTSPSGYTRNLRWAHSSAESYQPGRDLNWVYLNAASDPPRGTGDSLSTSTSASTYTNKPNWVNPNAPNTSNPTPPIGGGHPSSPSPGASTTNLNLNVQWVNSNPTNYKGGKFIETPAEDSEEPVKKSDRQQKQREYKKTLKQRRKRQDQLIRSGEFDRILSLPPQERQDLLLWNLLMKEAAQATPEHSGPNPTSNEGKGKGKGREDPQRMVDMMNRHQDSGPSSMSSAHYIMNPHRGHGESSSSSSNQHQKQWGDRDSHH